jgi:hypothetical protein
MKKPKKITAAKPRSRRASSTPATPPAEPLKAKAAGKKSPTKRVRKAAVKKAAPAVEPVAENKPAPASESKAVTIAKQKTKTTLVSSPKSVSKPEPPAKTESAPEPLAVAPAKPRARTKRITSKPAVSSPPSPPQSGTKGQGEEALRAHGEKQSVAPEKPVAVGKSHAEPKSRFEKPAAPISDPATKPPARPPRKAPARIPAILLEGDKPEPSPISGPGQRYALGPSAPVENLKTEGELPESYGTGELILAARDPHWLYTHWDLSGDQQRRYNSFSRDGHLVVRVYVESPGGKPAAEVHVHPESRHWFIHVARANTRYVAELGYYSAADRWKAVATSAATLTPPDAVSADATAEFSTIPFEVPMEKLLSLVKEAVQENPPLAEALRELREEGFTALPHIEAAASNGGHSQPWTPSEWTPAQERALAEVVSMDHVRRVWMGSLEITELIRRQVVQELASMSAAGFGAPAFAAPTSPAGAVTGISSPTRKAAPPKGFWFNVNAELIVYGATEQDATVSIGGRKIKLRPDGSFSYRFALPDGHYEMPVVAISADQTDGRAAEMKFSRATEYRGDVGAHPQDPALQQMLLENF